MTNTTFVDGAGQLYLECDHPSITANHDEVDLVLTFHGAKMGNLGLGGLSKHANCLRRQRLEQRAKKCSIPRKGVGALSREQRADVESEQSSCKGRVGQVMLWRGH